MWRRGRFGAWWTLVRLPSLTGGVALMFILTSALGCWQGLELLLWLRVGVLLSTPSGERLAVRVALGFRPLSTQQRQLAVSTPVGPTVTGRIPVIVAARRR